VAHAPDLLGWDTPGAVFRLTQHLRQGATVVLPTETLYGLSCVATDAAAVARLAKLKGIDTPRGFVALVARCEMIEPFLAADQDPRAVEFLRRVWPAPLSAILAVRSGLPWSEAGHGQPTAAFRVPAHVALLQLLSTVDAPVVSTSANRTGEPPLGSAAAIAAVFGPEVAAIVLERPPDRPPGRALRRASTLADFTTWPPAVRRAGSFDLDAALVTLGLQAVREPDRRSSTPVRLLFVCTGNTCRSPLAAALARRELAARGIHATVDSAGVNPVENAPASPTAVAAGREAQLDLASHRARLLLRSDVLAADLILVMEETQKRFIGVLAPEALERVHALRDYATQGAESGNVEDPFGGDLAAYRRTLAELSELVTQSLGRWLAEAPRRRTTTRD
jgi:protein-tyrosine phosphatase